MHYDYKTAGTCAKKISFDMDENGVVTNIVFLGGCPGNLQAIPKILEGWKADEISTAFLETIAAAEALPVQTSLQKVFFGQKNRQTHKIKKIKKRFERSAFFVFFL